MNDDAMDVPVLRVTAHRAPHGRVWRLTTIDSRVRVFGDLRFIRRCYRRACRLRHTIPSSKEGIAYSIALSTLFPVDAVPDSFPPSMTTRVLGSALFFDAPSSRFRNDIPAPST
jgi:hypothetical protein